MTKRISHTGIILLLASAAGTTTVQAQNSELAKNARQIDPPAISSQLMQPRVRPILQDLNNRVLTGFKGKEKLKAEMENELKRIKAVKSATDKRAAIAAYQKKYHSAYEQVLRAGAVDLNQVAGRLRNELPGIDFTVTPNFTIKAKSSTPGVRKITAPSPLSSGAKLNAPTANSAPNAIASTSPVEERSSLSFVEQESRRSCGSVAGGDVTVRSRSIKATSFAAQLGGCESKGTLGASVEVPANAKSARIVYRGEMNTEAFAVGILGDAFGYAQSRLGCDGGDSEYIDTFALAPLFWAASSEASQSTELQFDRRCKKLFAQARTNSIAGGAVTETHSMAEVRNLKAELIVQR
jgi:hypothetical protein